MQICVTLAARSLKQLRAAMVLAFDAGADLCELRLDRLDSVSTSDVATLLRDRTGPVVVTVRTVADGGAWRGDEDDRRQLLVAASEAGADWIDVEADVAATLPMRGSARRIVSVHDFDGTPEDLPGLLEALRKLPGDVVKIAVMPRGFDDVLRVLDAAKTADFPAICLSMGNMGGITRVLAGRYGAPWTYAAPDVGVIAAPGQYRLRTLRRVLRYHRISATTRLFGLLGDPVAHSLSPHVHNAAFELLDLDAAYLALRIPSPDLRGAVRRLESHGFAGFSVTIPHKQRIGSQADGADAIVRAADATNTLVLRPDPDAARWWATNTDLPAAVAAIGHAVGGTDRLEGKTVLVLGAGGVASAAALGLTHAGCRITVTARRVEQSRALAQRVGGEFVLWSQRSNVRAEIVVNGTPVGMHPNVDASPLPLAGLVAGAVVFDTVYIPERTQLICDAERRGCKVVTGVHMFVEQAAQQFELFTARDAPRELMGEVVRRELQRRRDETQ